MPLCTWAFYYLQTWPYFYGHGLFLAPCKYAQRLQIWILKVCEDCLDSWTAAPKRGKQPLFCLIFLWFLLLFSKGLRYGPLFQIPHPLIVFEVLPRNSHFSPHFQNLQLAPPVAIPLIRAQKTHVHPRRQNCHFHFEASFYLFYIPALQFSRRKPPIDFVWMTLDFGLPPPRHL